MHFHGGDFRYKYGQLAILLLLVEVLGAPEVPTGNPDILVGYGNFAPVINGWVPSVLESDCGKLK
jgi:hypothetical protein